MRAVETVKSSRSERARETRRRMRAAAYDLFCEQGYVPTTLAHIAERAGVAVQTVRFTFHTKPHLLKEVIEVYSAGQAQPSPVMERGWMTQVLEGPDAGAALDLLVEHGTDIYVRMAPLKRAIETAASMEPEVASLWSEIAAERRNGMRRVVASLADRGVLAPGLTIEKGTDLLFVLQSHEVFSGLAGSGWSIAEYKSWQARNLRYQLLGGP